MPTIAEGFHRKEAARGCLLAFAIIYYCFLGGSGLANRITESAAHGKTTRTLIADGKISGKRNFREYGRLGRSSRS